MGTSGTSSWYFFNWNGLCPKGWDTPTMQGKKVLLLHKTFSTCFRLRFTSCFASSTCKNRGQRCEGIEENIFETAGNAEVRTGDNTRSNEKCAMALHHASCISACCWPHTLRGLSQLQSSTCCAWRLLISSPQPPKSRDQIRPQRGPQNYVPWILRHIGNIACPLRLHVFVWLRANFMHDEVDPWKVKPDLLFGMSC